MRLDVSVANILRVDVPDCTQQLVRKNFDEQVGHLFHCTLVKRNIRGQCAMDVVHHNIKLCLPIPNVFVRISYSYAVRVVKHIEYIKLFTRLK